MKENVKKIKMKKASSCIELYFANNILWKIQDLQIAKGIWGRLSKLYGHKTLGKTKLYDHKTLS